MHRRTRFIALLAVVLTAALAATAVAALSTGKLSSFKYDSTAKTGKLVIVNAKGKKAFTVNKTSNCGVSYGQSGDQIACKSLGASKYAKKHIRVTWKAVGSAHVASLVVVDMAG